MHLNNVAGLIFLISGVFPAPLDSPGVPLDKKPEDAVPSNKIQAVPTDALIKTDSIESSKVKEEKSDSLISNDNIAPKPAILNDDSSTIIKISSSDAKSEISSASNNIDKNAVSESVDVHIDNHLENKLKEVAPTASVNAPSLKKDDKVTIRVEAPTQQPGMSQVIGNLIYEVLQAPLHLLRAVKDLIGGVLAAKLPLTSTSVVTSSAP